MGKMIYDEKVLRVNGKDVELFYLYKHNIVYSEILETMENEFEACKEIERLRKLANEGRINYEMPPTGTPITLNRLP